MKWTLFVLPALLQTVLFLSAPADAADSITIKRDVLRDKIHGAWAGMLIGGLEGLSHELKYNEQPRDTLPDFNLSVTGGIRSDDDNDFELTHLYYIDKLGVLKIPYDQIVEIWKLNINEGIWCANKEARALMDKGVVPPATANPARNSFASFNLSGQFAVEMYGAICPGMPDVASDLSVHYAAIAVSGEPLHAAAYWASLVSLAAVHTGPIEDLLLAALPYVDEQSCQAQVVQDAIRQFRANPDNWKAARQAIHGKWLVEKKWNNNSTPSNGGMVVLALLYGRDDFYKTLQYAMAMGLDADCNAATAGAVLGMRHGYSHIASRHPFDLGNTYVNTTRPGLPGKMKIDDQIDMFMRIAERVVKKSGV